MKLSTVLRAVCSFAAVCAFTGIALGQSVLNFTPKGPARIAITNTTPHTADVKFILYGPDGTVDPGVSPAGTAVAIVGQLRGIALQRLLDPGCVDLGQLRRSVTGYWDRALRR